jgi:excisionase family DNA binding protein
MITMKRAADEIGCSNHTIRKWIEDGALPAVRLPHGRVGIWTADWERFLQSLPPAVAIVESLASVEPVKTE